MPAWIRSLRSWLGLVGAAVKTTTLAQEAASVPRWIDIHGVTFAVGNGPADYGAFWSRVSAGTWEPETLALMDRLLTPGSRFVDIGAWIGPTSLYAAAKGAVVDAYECDPIALDRLKYNISLNPTLVRRIAVHEFAIGDSQQELQVWSGQLGNSETSVFANHEREGVLTACSESAVVRMRDAAQVFQECGYAQLPSTLIKIDTEGAEFRIVPRLAEIIAGSRAVWYISFHELNINSTSVPVRFARIAEMLRALMVFSDLNWYSSNLKVLDKTATLDAVLHGTWPPHGSLVFSSRSLTP
jgi:FkbM family methyltransferase